MNNYNAVRAAVAMMTDARYFALRRSAVTVSTVHRILCAHLRISGESRM